MNLKNKIKKFAIKAKENVKKVYDKASYAILGMIVSANMMLTPVFADPEKVNIKTDLDTEGLAGGIVGLILNIATYTGVILAAAGVLQIILALKDDNSEQQARGIRLAIVGGVLLGLKGILQMVGLVG